MIKSIVDLIRRKDVFIWISLAIFLYFLLYFIYIALTTTPVQINESDSLGQHIPLAKAILEGKLFNPPPLHRGLGFYLPIGEIILALFIKLNIPLGFYNIVPYLLLFFLSFKLAKLSKLNDSMAIVFATAVCSINSILRLVPTQKNDIWVDVFFVWTLYLLQKSKKDLKYFSILGISTGLLIGVKYSGIVYVLILFIVVFTKLKRFVNFGNIIAFVIPVFIFGLSWYLRNFFVIGNPFYPVSVLGFKGNPDFVVPKGYQNFSTLRYSYLAVEAFISEYLIWALVPLFLIIIFIRNNKILNDAKTILIIGVLSFSTYLMSPTEFTRVNFTSNVRFLHISFILFILSLFLVAKKLKNEAEIKSIAILNSIAVFPMFRYQPKLIILWISVLVIIYIYFSSQGKKRPAS